MTVAPETPAPKKKGLSALAWVGIGCAVLVVAGAIALSVGLGYLGHKAKQFVNEAQKNPALATARLLAAADPDVEVVDSKSDDKKITFRNVKTGEEMVFNAEDVEKGKISFETKDGKMTVDANGGDNGTMTVTTKDGKAVFRGGAGAAADIPDWVPRYPGAEAAGAYAAQTAQGEGGAFSQSTSDSPKDVLDYFTKTLKSDGYEIQMQQSAGSDEGFSGMVVAALTDPARHVTVTASRSEGKTVAMVQYATGN
jgi:ketosteroid isomerase-like protein